MSASIPTQAPAKGGGDFLHIKSSLILSLGCLSYAALFIGWPTGVVFIVVYVTISVVGCLAFLVSSDPAPDTDKSENLRRIGEIRLAASAGRLFFILVAVSLALVDYGVSDHRLGKAIELLVVFSALLSAVADLFVIFLPGTASARPEEETT